MLATKPQLQDPFSPLTDRFLLNPYPFYKQLREEEPVFWSQGGGYWLILAYKDVDRIFRDITFSKHWYKAKSSAFRQWQDPALLALLRSRSKWMLNQDPPDHTRLRGLVNKAFTPATIEKLIPKIQSIANSLLNQAQASGAMDLVSEFAYPLPVIVIAQMLGVPQEDQDLFKRWSHAIAQTIDLRADAEFLSKARQATDEIFEYLKPLANDRRKNPKDDLLSALVAAEENGNKLTEEELLSNCVLLLVAGHETTVNQIGNAVLALANNPEQLLKLKNNPDLIYSASDEFLRYDSSVQVAVRLATEKMDLHGKIINPGDLVTLVIGSANRDPEQFIEPEKLDIARVGNKHISFGAGIHYCLGSSLARNEIQIAINSLLNQIPNFKLQTETLEYKPNTSLRGVKSLNITF